MPLSVFLVVLVAAAMHAGWNAIVKGSADKVLGMVAVAAAGSVLAAVVLPFVRQPEPASWIFLAASVAVHIVYFILVARCYQLADMSQAYPLMRGTAPLLVAIAGALVLGEHLDLAAVAGIALICGGILAMASGAQRGTGMLYALLNAVVIAAYTLLDGEGARRSEAPAAYAMWIFLLSGLPFVGFVLLQRGTAVLSELRPRLTLGLIGGAGTVGAYALVLWAMTRAPVAVVASLRETAILFGLAISAFALNERVGRARIFEACLIAAGAATLRLA